MVNFRRNPVSKRAMKTYRITMQYGVFTISAARSIASPEDGLVNFYDSDGNHVATFSLRPLVAVEVLS